MLRGGISCDSFHSQAKQGTPCRASGAGFAGVWWMREVLISLQTEVGVVRKKEMWEAFLSLILIASVSSGPAVEGQRSGVIFNLCHFAI